MRTIVASTALALCVFGMGSAAAQTTDTYMLVPGIKGESTHVVYKDWIEVFSLSQSFTGNKNSTACTVNIAKPLDRSGPPLWTAAVSGETFNEVRIDILRAGELAQKFYELTLTNARIVAINSSPAERIESLTISGNTATLKYFRQKADGSLDLPIEATVNCAK